MNSKKPLVSVVIPIYNAEKYLEETLKSVLEQTYDNLEIILVNHNSTDKSLQIINNHKAIDSRIHIVNLDINKGGPAYPRNIGVENSTGEYIAFLDSDDVWNKYKLQVQLAYMLDKNINFSSTNSNNIDEFSMNINSKSIIMDFIKKSIKKDTICDLIKYNFIATSSVVVSKKIVMNFNEKTEFISVEDFCLWLDLLKRPDVKYRYIDKRLLNYRILINSASDRSMLHKQRTKVNLCVLTFILKNSYYKIINCFYWSVIKIIVINFFNSGNNK